MSKCPKSSEPQLNKPIPSSGHRKIQSTPTHRITYMITSVAIVFMIISGLLYYWASSYSNEIDIGEIRAYLDVKELDGGSFRVEIVRVQFIGPLKNVELESFQYDLRNQNGNYLQSGIIGLDNLSGGWLGIDVTWDDDGDNDIYPGNGQADRSDYAGGPYSDPIQAQIRINDVISGNQSGKPNQANEGIILLSFYDSDLNGKLTSNDYFFINPPKNNSTLYGYSLSLTTYPGGEPSGIILLG